MRRVDTTSLRSHNLLLLLHHLRETEPASPKALVTSTGMQASTISRLLRGLAQRNLVESRGTVLGDGNGGRPTELWGLNGRFGASIGLYLASNVVAGISIDLRGRILDTCLIPFKEPEQKRSETLLALLRQAFDRLSNSGRMTDHPLIGVGVASMGLVNRQAREIRFFDARIGLTELLPPECDVLHVENDANAVARGETMRRSLKGVRDAVVLYAHEGIGAGLILGGRLHTGFRGAAGEVGYRACQLMPNPLDAGGEELIARFHAGVSNVVNLLNPEVVLLTGDLENLPEGLVNTLREHIKTNTNSMAREVRVMTAPCDPMDVAHHIAMIVMDEEVFQTAPSAGPMGDEHKMEERVS